MSDNNLEEQEMEAQALEAIFDQHFHLIEKNQWCIDILPEQDDDNNEMKNHVGCQLHVTLPITYPESSLPEMKITIIKGLTNEHCTELLQVATEEATNNYGIPCIFAVTERLREWLRENNVIGLDDISMHAIMIRKEKEKDKQNLLLSNKQQQSTIYESHQTNEEYTQAELEELIVTKRRAEGTPCNKENFLKWQKQFDIEYAEEIKQRMKEENDNDNNNTNRSNKNKNKDGVTVDKTGRLTGYQYFSDKTNNYEALEAAAERAEQDETAAEYVDVDEEDDNNKKNNNNDNNNDIDEELFGDDVDVDDLSFDDDDNDNEEDIDI